MGSHSSQLVLVCALVALASGATRLRDERGILNLAGNALGSAFGKAAGVIGDQEAIKEQCNARVYFKQENRYMEKRGILNLANKAIVGGLAGIGSIIGTDTIKGGCEANGYFQNPEPNYGSGGGGGGPVYVQGQQAPPPIIIYDPPTYVDEYAG